MVGFPIHLAMEATKLNEKFLVNSIVDENVEIAMEEVRANGLAHNMLRTA